jgi:hypothetical protein
VSTDWGGLLGTVVMAGVAIKATDTLLGRSNGRRKGKKSKGQSSPF